MSLTLVKSEGNKAPGMDRTTNQSLYGKLIVGFVKRTSVHLYTGLVYRIANGRLMAVHCTCHAEGFAAFGISWHREPCPLRREAFRWYRRPSDNWQFHAHHKALVFGLSLEKFANSAVLPMRRPAMLVSGKDHRKFVPAVPRCGGLRTAAVSQDLPQACRAPGHPPDANTYCGVKPQNWCGKEFYGLLLAHFAFAD